MGDPVTMLTISTMMSASGDLAEGNAARSAGNFNAAQLQAKGKAKYAEGTRRAFEASRQANITESNARAAMAGGGGSTTDAGASETLALIGAEGDYQALSALYEGKTERAGYDAQAHEEKRAGRAKQRGKKWKALSTLITGGSAAYESYKKPKVKKWDSSMTAEGNIW